MTTVEIIYTCSACGNLSKKLERHPLLYDVPICRTCWDKYHSGEFTIDETGNEIYCRWCGEGDGTLCLCDTCPKAFCSGCIRRNFGHAELKRIEGISERWNCFLCSPQSLEDLIEKKGWGTATSAKSKKQRVSSRPYLVCDDISRGREKFEIPVFNEVDDKPAPLDFVYVTKHVSGEDVSISNNPSFTSCCTCTDNCKDESKCECAQLMNGFAYDLNGTLIVEKPAGIYECNRRCPCHLNRCKNRLVGNGPHLKLEVFRCADPRKGWGVRCAQDILPGTYVADYIGEIMLEAHAESRGLSRGDEYLFQLDNWGRSQACQKLTELHLKKGLLSIPRELNVDTCILSQDKNEVASIVGEELAGILESKGALDRAIALGKLRESGATAESSAPRATSDIQSPVRRRATDTDGLAQTLSHVNAGKTYAAAAAAKAARAKKALAATTKAKRPGANPSSSSSSGKTSGSADDMDVDVDGDADDDCVAEGTKQTKSSTALSWAENNLGTRLEAWRNAVSIITDRAVLETEHNFDTFAIDARWFGSIGRFLNHSCEPNLDIVTVFVDSHDVRIPRVAFFSNGFIPAKTELCYDYGYYPGNVEGRHRACLCGATNCRKELY